MLKKQVNKQTKNSNNNKTDSIIRKLSVVLSTWCANSEREPFQIVLAKVLIFEVPLSQTSFNLYFFCCTFCCTVCFTVKLVPCYWLFTTLARESLDRHSVFFHFYSWLLNILHNAFGLQCAPFVPVWFSHYYFHGANFFLTFETPLAVIGTRFFGEVQRVSVPSEAYISRGNMDKFLSKLDENWN